jgi:hypothetical protein
MLPLLRTCVHWPAPHTFQLLGPLPSCAFISSRPSLHHACRPVCTATVCTGFCLRPPPQLITHKVKAFSDPGFWEYLSKNIAMRRACGQ